MICGIVGLKTFLPPAILPFCDPLCSLTDSGRLHAQSSRRRAEGGQGRGRTILDLTESARRARDSITRGSLRLLTDPRGHAPAPFGLQEARAAVARDYFRRGVDVVPERIALTASTSGAYGCFSNS